MIEIENLCFSQEEGGVGYLRLSRPEKLNAQTPAMWTGLTEMVRRLSREPDLRCLIVTGEGSSFSVGFDAGSMSELAKPLPTPEDREARRAEGLQWTESFAFLSQASFVTIAAVRGYALGAGFELAVSCDLRVVTRTAKLASLSLKYGLVPDGGATYLLPRLVGLGKARQLIFTAEMVTGEEAGRIGLAEMVVEDDELDQAALHLARQIGALSATGIRATKRSLEAGADFPLEHAVRFAQREQADCYASEDFARAAKSFNARMVS